LPAHALLLALVRGEAPPEGSDAAWAQALRLAERHGIAPLLHERSLERAPADESALRDFSQAHGLPDLSRDDHAPGELPEPARALLRAARISELGLESKREQALRRALEALADGPEPLPVLLIKGAASARTLYASPELRPRGDLDLLVAPAQRERALGRLFARGYAQHETTRGTAEDDPDWHELTLLDPRDRTQQIDLHFALSQPERHRLDAARLFEESRPVPAPPTGEAPLPGDPRLLGPEAAALVCIYSLAVHELTSPLVVLCDLARLLPICELEKLLAMAHDARLTRPLYVAAALLAQLGPRSLRGLPCAPYSLCGAPIDPTRLAALLEGAGLPLAVRAALRAAAFGYDLSRAPLARPHQLALKALLIDRPLDLARFAAAHALRSLRRAR